VRLLVTAGPTREHLDPVRYLSNPSSGRMGFACARAAARAGHEVLLVTGPVALPDPPGVKTVRVVSAEEMHRAATRAWPRMDAAIATAAVGDWRPKAASASKLKKRSGELVLRLVRTPDILLELGRRKGGRRLVGFALETDDGPRQARLKYERKNLDFVVLNGPASFGAGRMDAEVWREGKRVRRFRGATKDAVARWLVRALEGLDRPPRRS
jgi:phosphopantothenoylcysteine decarboxylase / phosphopantothenate---cysteine ligase